MPPINMPTRADRALQLQSFLKSKGVDPKNVSPADVSRLAKSAPVELQRLPLTELVELAHADVESLRQAAKVVDRGGAPVNTFGQNSTAKSPLFARGMAVPGDEKKPAAPSTSASVPNPLGLVPKRADYSINEYLRVGKAHLEYLTSALRDASATLASNKADSARLNGQAEQALSDFANAIVPDASPETLKHLGDVFGIVVAQKAKAGLGEGDALRAQVAAFPNARDIDSVQGDLDELKGVSKLQALASDADFKDLYSTGYGTSNYKGGVFKPSSWNDKSQEAGLVKRFQGLFADFKAIREAYDGVKDIDVKAKTAPLEKELAASKARSQLAALPEKERGSVVRIVRDALLNGDHAAIAKNLSPQEAQSFAAFAGPFHQAKMLDTFATTKLGPMETAIKKEIATTEAQLAEARGASKKPAAANQRIPRASLERIGSSSNRIATTQQSLSSAQTRIVEVHNYNSGMSFWEAYFWISVLTPSHHDHDVTNNVTNITNNTFVDTGNVQGGGGDFGGGGATGAWGTVDQNAAGNADPTTLFTPLVIDDHAGHASSSVFTVDPSDPNANAVYDSSNPNDNVDGTNDTSATDDAGSAQDTSGADASDSAQDAGAAASDTNVDAS